MKEQFVTYEIALKLKELGFDWPCFFAFDTCKTRCKDLRTNEQEFDGVNYNSSTYISQPLWQQAIDFVEFKHDILIQTEYNKTQKFWIYQIFAYEKTFDYIEEVGFESKYEAREQAILKAIELIKL